MFLLFEDISVVSLENIEGLLQFEMLFLHLFHRPLVLLFLTQLLLLVACPTSLELRLKLRDLFLQAVFAFSQFAYGGLVLADQFLSFLSHFKDIFELVFGDFHLVLGLFQSLLVSLLLLL